MPARRLRIMDVKPRPCANPAYPGKSFGSNAAAWWGFHYKELITGPKPSPEPRPSNLPGHAARNRSSGAGREKMLNILDRLKIFMRLKRHLYVPLWM